MDPEVALLLNAVVSGLLLGSLYAAASVGLAVSFEMLDVVNIAHPALPVLAAIAVGIARGVEKSRLDMGLAALRDDERAAEAAGSPRASAAAEAAGSPRASAWRRT